MTAWLYEIAPDSLPPERYQESVFEGELLSWPTRSINAKALISKGDPIVTWYDKAPDIEPGLYGWGVIVQDPVEDNEIAWRPAWPSDFLKVHPVFDEEMENLIHQIRGDALRVGMWEIPKTIADAIEAGIQRWTGDSPALLGPS